MSDGHRLILPGPASDADDFIGALRELSRTQAKDEFRAIKPTEARAAAAESHLVVERMLEKVEGMVDADYRVFTRRAILRMGDGLNENGKDSFERRAEELLYRAFDPMDQILEIDYERDAGMECLGTRERLYEGAGIGVQSSYTTILKALRGLSLRSGARLIDLGSGYGRVGLVAGLWREDVTFTGYEYVGHRVDVSRASAERAGVGERVTFVEQDLAAKDFKIPLASAYYLFDPFSEETYRHVLRQLAEIGREERVSVVTKADARAWFRDFVADAGWSAPEPLDEDTLLVFHSRP